MEKSVDSEGFGIWEESLDGLERRGVEIRGKVSRYI